MRATNEEEIQELAASNIDILLASGYIKPTIALSWADRAELVQSVTLHHVILECKTEIDQFSEGLNNFNVLQTIKDHTFLLKQFLCIRNIVLTPGTVYNRNVASYVLIK